MSSINKGYDALENFSDEQLANLEKSIDTLDKEVENWEKEEIEDNERRRSARRSLS